MYVLCESYVEVLFVSSEVDAVVVTTTGTQLAPAGLQVFHNNSKVRVDLSVACYRILVHNAQSYLQYAEHTADHQTCKSVVASLSHAPVSVPSVRAGQASDATRA